MTKREIHLFILVLSLLASACSDSDIIIHESSEKSESYLPPEKCQQISHCFTHDGLTLWLGNNEVKAEQEFSIFLHSKNNESLQIDSARIESINMNMGYIPLFFSKLSNNTYRASGLVGVCETQDMRWQIKLEISQQENNKVLTLQIPST
ncbi:hypothetical protein CWB72_08420 [Pseudoalteromonas phenolica]|uniref:hypothetical protein n=1 Tax=Pseudoalteromonas phenolica TaxID=161398 RepID=UPI00110A3B0A|nr:hypothetical protein [Pseudoalteromonas phenolica]TMN90554.1 hypothetical protein CWB72_08420 [Pseudoalteromonas phenolica]